MLCNWNKYTENKLSKITNKLKRKRVELFVSSLGLGSNDIILDLGSEDGSYLATYYPYPYNIVLADLKEEPMKRGLDLYELKGYKVIQEDGPLPFENGEFAAIWCNSTIEHVTLSRTQLNSTSNREFEIQANKHQRQFAQEIARVGKKYFVQTPYMHFPVEAHSWMPIVQYLPQKTRWKLSVWMKKLWVKQWSADFYLYDLRRFKNHFPDATNIHIERFCGIPKALIAIRSER